MTDQSSRDVWEHLGATDADWAVASRADRRNGAWADDLDSFYASGESRITEVLALLPDDAMYGSVLDFGSGTGRLSFALSKQFSEVTCADISSTMLRTLAERAAERGVTNLTTINIGDEKAPELHDVAISLITLQHVQSLENVSASLAHISRSLRPGGYGLIDFPTPPSSLRRRVQPRYRAFRALRTLRVPAARLGRIGLSGISMLSEDPGKFRERLAGHGLRVLDYGLAPSEFSPQATYLVLRE